MSEKTGIAWTDHTFNPWWGCIKVSPGCKHCYAETFSTRYGHDVWGPATTTTRRTFGLKHWLEPEKWNAESERDATTGSGLGRRHRVFSGSMCDVFEDHPMANATRDDLWGTIRLTPWLDWQLLTKRPENIASMLPSDWGDGHANVWLGTSVEDQERADERIHKLLDVPAKRRFLSCEPLIGPVDLSPLQIQHYTDRQIHWVIVGGESGGDRRPMEIDWLAHIVGHCRVSGVPVFVKQDNAFKPDQRGRIPDDLWIRQFPRSAA